MKWQNLVCLGVSGLVLTGCFTVMTWSEARGIDSGERLVDVGKDELRSFGMLKSSRQVVLMGEQYWFIADEQSSKELQGLLDAKMAGGFALNTMDVELDKDGKNWKMDRYLIYTNADTAEERAKLIKLGFERRCDDSCAPTEQAYGRLYHWQGQIYQKSAQGMDDAGQFSQRIPIRLQTKKYQVRGVGSTLGAIALTPVALVWDVVTLPVQAIIFSGSSGDIFR